MAHPEEETEASGLRPQTYPPSIHRGSQWGGDFYARLLRLSAKILALLRLSVNLFQLRLTEKLKINFFCFKELNINKPVFFCIFKQNKGLGIISE